MVKYVKCPRCELNYIDSEKQEYCDVCIAELKGNKLQFADLDDETYEELDSEIEQGDICPVCGVNRINAGEEMCEECKHRQEYGEEEEDVDMDKDEEWKNYLEEDEGDLTVDDTLREEIEEDFKDEDEEEDEFYNDDSDPLDDEEGLDSLDAFDDDDEDDDDDDEDEDDDF